MHDDSTKPCTSCGILKLLAEFSKKKGQPQPWCKICTAAYQRKWREEHPGKKAEHNRRWRAKNPEKYKEGYTRDAANPRKQEQKRVHYRTERAQQKKREWNERNQEKIKAQKRQRYLENSEDIKARSAAWRKANPEKRADAERRRQAAKAGFDGCFTRAEWQALCRACGYRCLACGEKRTLTVDHVVPLSKGGPHDISNIQPLCRSCNSRKQARIIDFRTGVVDWERISLEELR